MNIKKNIEIIFNPEIGKNIVSIIFNKIRSKILHVKYKSKNVKSFHLTKQINFFLRADALKQ